MGTPADRPKRIRLVAGLPEKLVIRGLLRMNRETDAGHRGQAFYLHEMQSRRLYQSTGHGSAVHFAVAVLDLSRRAARELLAVGEKLAELKTIDDAFCDGRLSWTKTRLLTRIATTDTEPAWLEKALACPTAADLERAMAGLAPGDRPRSDKLGIPRIRFSIRADVDAVTHAAWDALKERLAGESGETVTDGDLVSRLLRLAGEEPGPASKPLAQVVVQRCPGCRSAALPTPDGPLPLDDLTAEMVLCDAVSDETPASLRRKILARDGHCCVHCGQKNAGELHVHHVTFREHGGRTEPKNLATLCRHCHALVHEKLLGIAGEAPHALAFTDKDGNPVVGPRPADWADAVKGVRIVRIDRARGAAAPLASSQVIDTPTLPDPVPPGWARERGLRWVWSSAAKSMRTRVLAPAASVPPAAPPQSGPKRLDDFVGQERVVASLRAAVRGAKKAGKPLDPVLLTGGAGLGKTAFAEALALEVGARARAVSAPMVLDLGRIATVLVNDLAPGDVLFIDEFHALPVPVVEALYRAIDHRRLEIDVRDGGDVRTVEFELPPFTLVAATNKPERLPQAIRTRFTIHEHLESYEICHLAEIARRTAAEEGRLVDAEGALVIARASRGTARDATLLARRVIRVADGSEIEGPLGAESVKRALAIVDVDANGLTAADRKLVETLRASKVPLSSAALAAKTGMSRDTLVELHEPYLLKLGLVEVTRRGRVARMEGVPALV